MNRRSFLSASTILMHQSLSWAQVKPSNKPKSSESLLVLTTNDVHSQIEPFSAKDSRFPNMGGFARRSFAVNALRKQYPNVLLLDSGDVFQGSPYFNYYKGALEYSLMKEMGYDAGTLGNHDFDLGLENLALQLPLAQFPMVCSNYEFKNTVLDQHPQIRPFIVLEKGPFKIGLYGLGVNLNTLLSDSIHNSIVYHDPLERAQYWEAYLHHTEQCHLILCLSHLGYQYSDERISDIRLAQALKYTHYIAGGHTHTFLDKPVLVQNASRNYTIISQQGWGGVWMGSLEFSMHKKSIFSNFRHSKLVL